VSDRRRQRRRPAEVSETGDTELGRPAKKAITTYRTIGDVAGELDLPAHVLRFWESKFPQLEPLKRSDGWRYYRPEDVVLVRRIRQCLYQESYTICGVQRLLNGAAEDGEDARVAVDPAAPTLFPLDPVPQRAVAIDHARTPARPARRSRSCELGPEVKAALAEIRQELLEARALLEELASLGKASPS
jgi:DNA-binding transcriptional MerR regulator